jgi:hypothetical protein
MLGCHEFCGYYEWTFHFVRRRWGQEAVARLWAEAIGGESQRHYTEAAQAAGLTGLYQTWIKTGHDEACDWTFTLDEVRNVLRWDMRNCPSKGFLLSQDRNADEDYCDHCMGWMIPLLAHVGVEVWEHEHNHLGQCWGTMRLAHRPSQPPAVEADIRSDPRWSCGYLDRWERNRKQALAPGLSSASDACQLLHEWFARCDRLVVMTDRAYVGSRDPGHRPLGVLIGHGGVDLDELARRWHDQPPQQRPLLMHPYLPGRPVLDVTPYRLPRPVPILPLVIRAGHYVHRPGGPDPSPRSLLAALARALGKELVLLDDLDHDRPTVTS